MDSLYKFVLDLQRFKEDLIDVDSRVLGCKLVLYPDHSGSVEIEGSDSFGSFSLHFNNYEDIVNGFEIGAEDCDFILYNATRVSLDDDVIEKYWTGRGWSEDLSEAQLFSIESVFSMGDSLQANAGFWRIHHPAWNTVMEVERG